MLNLILEHGFHLAIFLILGLCTASVIEERHTNQKLEEYKKREDWKRATYYDYAEELRKIERNK